jgi:simple sugar transport system substrate-binding protein
VRGGLDKGYVKLSPYGEAVSTGAKEKADAAKAALSAGSLAIFTGPLKDNDGKTVIAEGVSHGQTDIALEKMDYLVEGVKGSLN